MATSSIEGRASSTRCKWMTLGDNADVGRSLNPLLNQECVAILIRDVSTSYQRIFLVVYGTYPRNIPFRELGLSLAFLLPGGRTHTRHPKVRRCVKFSRMDVANSSGEMDRFRSGNAFRSRSEW